MIKIYTTIGIITLCVLSALVYAFMVVGGPNNARNQKLDQTRVERLRTVTYKINSYQIAYNKLPEKLSYLTVDSWSPMTDPETNKEFGYEIISDTSYRICATFLTATNDKSTFVGEKLPTLSTEPTTEINFDHPKGYYCFSKQLASYPSYMSPSPVPYITLEPTPTSYYQEPGNGY